MIKSNDIFGIIYLPFWMHLSRNWKNIFAKFINTIILLKDVNSRVFLTSMNQPLFNAGRHKSWSKECVALVSAATTLWSPTRAHFLSRPENFVVGAIHFLMISTRISIPMAVLHHVLSFCPRTWFDVASKKRLLETSSSNAMSNQQFKRTKR